MNAAASDVGSRVARARRALRASGRRLMQLGDGGWAVMVGVDRRRRVVAVLERSEGRALVEGGEVAPAEGGGYVLAARGGEPGAARPAGAAIFSAAGVWRARRSGNGFAGLARHAGEPGAALSLRQVRAGLRLIADAERGMRTARLGMDWSATPAARGRRSGRDGGQDRAARAAMLRLARLKAADGPGFALAWAACVEGRALAAIERRFGLAKRRAAAKLAEALEGIAERYDGGS